MGAKAFSGVIRAGRGGGAYVEVPFDVEPVFGSKRPPVNATIDGEPYRTRLVRMGTPCHVIGVPSAIRATLGKGVGDIVRITVMLDAAPRVVDPPPDLVSALDTDAAARAAYDGLAYTHRKEYVRWIEEAKRPDTRARRVAKTVEMLKAGRRGR